MAQYTNVVEIINQGYAQLTADEILNRLSNKTVWGDYLMGYRFMSYFNSDGTTEGTNNVGSFNKGNWLLDTDNNTLSITWDASWVASTTHAYNIDGVIHFFDVDTGLWRNSITHFKNERVNISVDNIVY